MRIVRCCMLAVLMLMPLSGFASAQFEIDKINRTPFLDVAFVDGMKSRGNALGIADDKLYYGAANILYILDISIPSKPVLQGRIKLEGLCRQIAVQNGIVYVACRESGVWIVDATDPSSPKLASRYDPIELATGIDVCGNVLFLSERINGVEFVDVSDIYHPEHIRLQKTAESQSVWYQNGILYSGEWGRHQITSIDASDMADVKILSKTNLWGNGDGVFAQNGILFAATGHHSYDKKLSKEDNFGNGHSLQMFDICGDGRLELASTTRFANLYTRGNDYWMARPSGDGRLVFVADTFNGLYSVDSGTSEITGRIRFRDKNGKALAVSSVAVAKGVVYASVYNGGLAVVTCPKAKPSRVAKGKAPVNHSFRYAYNSSDYSHFTNWKPQGRYPVRSVAAKGPYLFAACSDGGLAILRTDESGTVELVGHGPQSFVEDVKIRGNKLYSAEGRNGLGIYEIENDFQLRECDRITDIGNGSPFCLWVEVPSDDCIIASPRGEYYWIDSSNPHGENSRVLITKTAGWDRYVPNNVFGANMYAHARPHMGLMWVDLSSGRPVMSKPASEIKVNQKSGISNYKDGRAVVVIQNKLYYLQPGEMSLPASGVEIGVTGAPMWDGAEKLAITNRVDQSINLYDMTDDSKPVSLLAESTSGQPEMPIFHEGRLIVPCGYQGLLIQK